MHSVRKNMQEKTQIIHIHWPNSGHAHITDSAITFALKLIVIRWRSKRVNTSISIETLALFTCTILGAYLLTERRGNNLIHSLAPFDCKLLNPWEVLLEAGRNTNAMLVVWIWVLLLGCLSFWPTWFWVAVVNHRLLLGIIDCCCSAANRHLWSRWHRFLHLVI